MTRNVKAPEESGTRKPRCGTQCESVRAKNAEKGQTKKRIETVAVDTIIDIREQRKIPLT